ncbi:MAG: hypothetical protein J0I33_00050 [Microbacterium ginsengisoli]|uniref:hypothetical protein n=2 Tax=Microbacteriaceae TaxID=85023 RepID=UPI000700FBAB|nr:MULTISPECIES: hypothetical protein [unclassified Microbacterium]KQR94178.1 hypothetical protein ASG00_14030 [Microbacterium sp. Leaf351]KQR95729.1 hypothetical protein ASF93_14025 [Microbacterium sp. Leaf347]MBN9197024.1 hypothetical protein [Microbacterium ginsengisoli]
MSLADEVRATVPDVPAEWRARQVVRGDEVEIVTGPIEPVATDAELLRSFGYDPAEIEVVGTINQWRKQLPDGQWRVSYFFRSRPRSAKLDLPALAAAARRKPRPALRPVESGPVTVAVLSDPQIGKTGSRGGTPELLERLEVKKAALARHLRDRKPARTVLAEAGDLFEGFESGGNPAFTNDLSLAQQMDMAGLILFDFVSILRRHGHVDVLGVPSNHTAWRSGKRQLGRPGDDFGLHVHRHVERLARAHGFDVDWHLPGQHDEAVTLDVLGTVLGVVHGNQYRAGRAVEWWRGQQHGGQPVGAADVLVTGHFHSLSVMPTGRNPYTGRAKWWLQAPTLDNGSDWFRNLTGDDSDPGLLVFDITERGFDLQSLTVL